MREEHRSDESDHESLIRPPHTLREMVGLPTLVTGLAALGLWLLAAGYSIVVIGLSVIGRDKAAVTFAVVELGSALVIVAALGIFATLVVFLVTAAIKFVRTGGSAQRQ